jgi:hypothetical protein
MGEWRVGDGEEVKVRGPVWVVRDGLAIGREPVFQTWCPPGPGGRPSFGALDRRFTHTHNAILRRGGRGGYKSVEGDRTQDASRSTEPGGQWAVGVHPDRKSWGTVL